MKFERQEVRRQRRQNPSQETEIKKITKIPKTPEEIEEDAILLMKINNPKAFTSSNLRVIGRLEELKKTKPK